MAKKTKRHGFIYKLIVSLLVILLVLGAAAAYFRFSAWDFYKNAEKVFVIPEINDGFIPGGIAYDEETGNFLVCGRYTGNDRSALFAVTGENTYKKLLLTDKDGSFSGIEAQDVAICGKFVYVLCKDGVFVYEKEDISNSQSGKAEYKGKLFSDTKADFLCADGDVLYVGKSGRMYEYGLSEKNALGVSEECLRVYLLPEDTQSVSVKDGGFFVITKRGIGASGLYYCDAKTAADKGKTEIEGEKAPCFSVAATMIEKEIKLPAMTTDAANADGYLYMLSDFASNKYLFGKLTGARWAYRIKA